MSRKRLKPPLAKDAILARLERARDERLEVRVRRWIPGADPVDGFVVGIGARWVALAKLADGVVLDGWSLLRIEDVQAVAIDPDADCFTVKVLRARSQWPPPAADVELDDLHAAVRTASAAGTMTSVFVELDRPDICYVGALLSVDEERVRLLQVDTQGEWARQPRPIDPGDVTRLDFGGLYEDALSLVAGPVPVI